MTAHSVFVSKLTAKRNSYFILFVACVVVVALNLISSQSYPTIMYGLLQGSEHSQILYLRKMWGSSLYGMEIDQLKDDNRERLLEQANSIERERQAVIQSLEETIGRYPYAPEPYYNLSILYRSQGDSERAGEYLRKAQQIDPSLK